MVGLLGILKAGGAYVPLDPAYPRERLAFMLEDARPPVLLTQAHLRAPLPAQRRSRRAAWTPTRRARRASPRDARAAASTAGRPRLRHLHLGLAPAGPRACVIPHRGAVCNLRWSSALRRPELRPGQRVLPVRLALLRHLRAASSSPAAARAAPSASWPRRDALRAGARAAGRCQECTLVDLAPAPSALALLRAGGAARRWSTARLAAARPAPPSWRARWRPRRRLLSTSTAPPRPPSAPPARAAPGTRRAGRPSAGPSPTPGLRAGRAAAPGAGRRARRAATSAATAWRAATSAGPS